MTRVPKILIASTVRDLAAYRRAVVDAIRQLSFEPVEWERGAATNPDQTAESAERADAIVLIVGYRYGSLLPGTGKGWVEAEYEMAQRLGKPICAFLASDKAPWPASAIDVDRSNVEAFRARLQRELRTPFFSSPSELAANVVAALTTYFSRPREPQLTNPAASHRIYSVSVVRMLLSSPGDVAEERDRVSRAVFRFNQVAVEERSLFIKLIRWEEMAPQIGPGPQHVINKQMSDYDLFVGIMWNRFGTRTDVAASGTKEEFDAAVQDWTQHRRPWITFYFCDRPSNLTRTEQLDQKRLVLEFRELLNGMGVVRSFLSPDEFEDLIYRDLHRITSTSEFTALVHSR